MRRFLALLTVLLIAAGSPGPAGAVTNPVSGPYPQAHGEMLTDLPTAGSCTTTVVQDFRFHNTAYGADAPFTGSYVPTCAGPWSEVVMTMSAFVQGGTQFDRIGDVLVGGMELLHLTTPEGEGQAATSWSIQRDVTPYASLFRSTQPTYFIIGNQTDDTYTGDFFGSLSFSFYRPDAAHPATTGADALIALSQVDRGLRTVDERTTGHQPEVLTTQVSVPANTTTLAAELFTSGHGGEEEDWWDAPGVCATGGISYREVTISVDGRLAGTAPVFPTIYTGGYGPDFWRPVPSPRALNLRPYTFDLTPFVGQLTDGASHAVTLQVVDQQGCEGYWFLGGNLLATTNKASSGRTTGAVTAHAGPLFPTSTGLGTDADGADRSTSTHALDVTGTVLPAGVTIPTTVRVVEDLQADMTTAVLDVVGNWTWTSSTTRTTGAQISRATQTSTYQLIRTGPSWTLEDDQDTTTVAGSTTTATTSLQDRMTSGGPVVGVTGVVGTQQETWRYASALSCTQHDLIGSNQNILQDAVSSCSGAGTPTPTPTPTVPEAPVALLLPATGIATAALVLRSRRRTRRTA